MFLRAYERERSSEDRTRAKRTVPDGANRKAEFRRIDSLPRGGAIQLVVPTEWYQPLLDFDDGAFGFELRLELRGFVL